MNVARCVIVPKIADVQAEQPELWRVAALLPTPLPRCEHGIASSYCIYCPDDRSCSSAEGANVLATCCPSAIDLHTCLGSYPEHSKHDDRAFAGYAQARLDLDRIDR